MRELSLHILDIVQNSIRANATEVTIHLNISTATDVMVIQIEDNGIGMSPAMVAQVLDPFVTTRTTRKVGLGLPLFQQAAERCDGYLTIDSVEGQGTKVRVQFKFSHIDRAPMGDITATMVTLVQGNPEIDFTYVHHYDDREYELSTKVLRRELEGVPLNHPLVLEYISNDMKDGLAGLLVNV